MYSKKKNNYLIHYGVLGMKWGVRKAKNKKNTSTIKTKSGETLSITEKKNGRFIAKNSKNRKVGTFYLDENAYGRKEVGINRKDKALHIDWLSVSKKHEGKGYGQAMMKYIDQYAKNKKYDSITSEVVGVSPNMKHILEKNGHKSYGQVKSELWGDLTVMEKRFKK